MAIKLPTIESDHFLGMSVCGQITTSPDAQASLFDGIPRHLMNAEVEQNSTPTILSVYFSQKSGNTLHIDYVRSQEFVRGLKEPLELSPLDQILGHIDRMMGKSIRGTFFGRFVLPIEFVSHGSLITYPPLEIGLGGLSISYVGGHIEIKGAPIDSLKWRVSKDKGLVAIDLEGRLKLDIHEDYLVTSYNYLINSFKAFILDRDNDDADDLRTG